MFVESPLSTFTVSHLVCTAAPGRRWLSDSLYSGGNEGSKMATANQWLSQTSKPALNPEEKAGRK